MDSCPIDNANVCSGLSSKRVTIAGVLERTCIPGVAIPTMSPNSYPWLITRFNMWMTHLSHWFSCFLLSIVQPITHFVDCHVHGGTFFIAPHKCPTLICSTQCKVTLHKLFTYKSIPQTVLGRGRVLDDLSPSQLFLHLKIVLFSIHEKVIHNCFKCSIIRNYRTSHYNNLYAAPTSIYFNAYK